MSHSPLPPTTSATVFSAPNNDDSLSEGTLQEGPEGPSDGASDAQLS